VIPSAEKTDRQKILFTSPTPIATVAAPRPLPAAILFRPGFVDVEGAATDVFPVQSGDGLVGFAAVCHLDESETSRAARIPVRYYVDARHGSIWREDRTERLFSCTEIQVAYKNAFHWYLLTVFESGLFEAGRNRDQVLRDSQTHLEL
jgi:hypothetical protein